MDYLGMLKSAELRDRQDVRWQGRRVCPGLEAPGWTCLDPIQALSPPPLSVFFILHPEG